MAHHHIHHQHAPRAEVVARDDGQYVETVVSVVWVTADPVDAQAASTAAATTHGRHNGSPIQNTRVASSAAAVSAVYRAPSRQVRPEAAVISSATAAASSVAAVVSSKAAIGASSASAAAVASVQQKHTTLVQSAAKSSGVASAASLAGALNSEATSLGSSSSTASSNSDGGLSSGAKAGIALAVIALVALLCGLAFFFIRRKKKLQQEEHQRLDDEKSEQQRSQSISSHVSVRRSKTNAPRLSLRPFSQMVPVAPVAEKEYQNGYVARSRTPDAAPAPINPFGDDAEHAPEMATPAAAAVSAPLAAKLDEAMQSAPVVDGPAPAFPAAVAGSRRNSPPGPGPNNVHRVHIDFKPSMDDELELRAGTLVRLLHEYDDGWALCIRLDRSQQGVVPRTCISKQPVKPRPGPPPPGVRGPPPQGRPASNPRMSGPMGAPRPMPPPGARTRAPTAPAGFAQNGAVTRPRANSDAMSARRMTPPSGLSPASSASGSPPQATQIPARKPVPGQAM